MTGRTGYPDLSLTFWYAYPHFAIRAAEIPIVFSAFDSGKKLLKPYIFLLTLLKIARKNAEN